QILLTASRAGHDYFTQLLDEVSRFGTTWQVVVSMSVFRAEQVESIEEIDWQDAVKFAGTWPEKHEEWPETGENPNSKVFSISMETVSFDYAPYLTTILDKHKMTSLIEQAQRMGNNTLQSPQITLFSGQA